MHVTTTGRQLAAAITAARKAVTNYPHGERRAVIRRDGDAAYLVAADGEVQYAEVIGEADAGSPAPVEYVADLTALAALKGAELVTITPGGIIADGARLPVAVADPDYLPAVPDLDAPTVTVEVEGADAADLVAELHGVARAAATGYDARAVLTAVLIADGEAAATDTYRMHVGTVPTVGDGATLIPERAVRAIPARADYAYLAGDQAGQPWPANGPGAFVIRWGTPPRGRTPRRSGIIAGRAVEGPYPNYRGLIPSADELDGVPTVTTTGTLAAAIKPAATAARTLGRFPSVVLGWAEDAPGTVTVEAAGVEGATVTLGTATTGTGGAAFSPTYLGDADAYLGAGADLAVRDDLKSAVGTNGGRTALVMPMRVGS